MFWKRERLSEEKECEVVTEYLDALTEASWTEFAATIQSGRDGTVRVQVGPVVVEVEVEVVLLSLSSGGGMVAWWTVTWCSFTQRSKVWKHTAANTLQDGGTVDRREWLSGFAGVLAGEGPDALAGGDLLCSPLMHASKGGPHQMCAGVGQHPGLTPPLQCELRRWRFRDAAAGPGKTSCSPWGVGCG